MLYLALVCKDDDMSVSIIVSYEKLDDDISVYFMVSYEKLFYRYWLLGHAEAMPRHALQRKGKACQPLPTGTLFNLSLHEFELRAFWVMPEQCQSMLCKGRAKRADPYLQAIFQPT